MNSTFINNKYKNFAVHKTRYFVLPQNITHIPKKYVMLKTQDHRPKSLTKFVIISKSKVGVPLAEESLQDKIQHKHCNVELVSGFFFHLHGSIAPTDAFNLCFVQPDREIYAHFPIFV